ncbi:MAG: hypothetical protein KF808_02200 [Cryobacterium sp.]|nr:hypothetical protein [Cryobacterium sp.]
MKNRAFAIVMGAVLAIYLVAVSQTAIRLIGTDQAIAKVIGVALLVLPILGAWGLVSELWFGWKSGQLGRELESEGRYPLVDLERLPSGRIDPAAAREVFDDFKAETERAPEEWQSWYRLGLAYDACGDRRRARSAIRSAIQIYQNTQRAKSPA